MAKRRYDGTFKKGIARLYLDNERSAQSLANEIGVHENDFAAITGRNGA